MRRLLPILVAFSPTTVPAQEASVVSLPKKVVAATSLLPNGSQLNDVILPRYDENRRLVGVLKAKVMTLVNPEQIAGETVSVEMLNPDLSPRGRIDLTRAAFYQGKGLLVTNDPTEIQTDRMRTRANGLYYAFDQGEGFMPGPATTTILAPTETTMLRPQSTLRATAILGLSLLTQPLGAAAPATLSPAEMAAIQADAVTKAPAVKAASTAANASLDKDRADSAKASDAAAKFLNQSGLPAVAADAIPAPSKPLEIQPSPADTVVHCEGGMYFDADEGVLVYLKNVTVKDPRFELSGANELKIFLGQKTSAKEDSKPKSDSPANKKRYGSVERIVATGAILIDQKAAEPGKEPIKASGALFTYNVKTEQIILSGGYPWITQGKTYMRAKEPNLVLRIFPKTGSFVTEGNWDMGGNLEQKR